nr:hypothetical protein [Tanacetum cinerariifolium]
MPSRIRTQSVGRPVVESRGRRTGERVGRGGRGRGPRRGNDERVDELNGQGNDQGLRANGGIEGVNGNVERVNEGENVGNVLVNGNRVGCSYKEFLACNPKEYDGKGGAVVLTRWIEKMENVQDMSGCSIYMLSRKVVVSMSWNEFKFMMIEEFVLVMKCKIQKLSCGITLWSGLAMLRILICRMVATTELKTIQKAVQIFGALTDEA